MEKKICGIYVIVNQVNRKIYIGKSVNILNRWRHHKWVLNRNKHANIYLQNSWNKHGSEKFTFEILEECEEEMLHLKEIEWIRVFSTTNTEFGYNIREEDENNKLSIKTKTYLKIKRRERYNKLVEKGYYTCILYNLNNDTQVEYNSPEEARANSTLTKGRRQNFITGEVLIAKKGCTPEKIDIIIKRYNRYIKEQKHVMKVINLYAVYAYDFNNVKITSSKTAMSKLLFNTPKATGGITKIIDTNKKYRHYYFFSSKENMDNILPNCYKAGTKKKYKSVYIPVIPKHKFILTYPDGSTVYLYKGVDAINHIPDATKKGVQKLMSGERSHYYKYTIEKINTGGRRSIFLA